MLTGHTHDATHHAFAVQPATGQTVACHELRSAQSVGFGKAQRGGAAEDIGFLTHRLSRQARGQVRWDVWRWYWRNGRYEPKTVAPWHSFTARLA